MHFLWRWGLLLTLLLALAFPVQADITSNLAACWGLNEGTGGAGKYHCR